MEIREWQQMDNGGVMTPGGDPVWICPVCNRGLHVCGIESPFHKVKCPDCGIPLKYPWEKISE